MGEPSNDIDFSDVGFNGGVNIGWGFKNDWFYFAPEFYAHYSATEPKLSLDVGDGDVGTMRLVNNGDIGLVARAGAFINEDTLAYVKGGGSWAEYEFKLTESDFNGADKKRLWGWVVGGGLEARLFNLPNVTIGADYTYLHYAKDLRVIDNEGDIVKSDTTTNHRANIVFRYYVM